MVTKKNGFPKRNPQPVFIAEWFPAVARAEPFIRKAGLLASGSGELSAPSPSQAEEWPTPNGLAEVLTGYSGGPATDLHRLPLEADINRPPPAPFG